MALEDRIARLVRTECQHPEFGIKDLANKLGVVDGTISLWRARQEYKALKEAALEQFNKETARIAAWKAAKNGTADSIIQENQAAAAQKIVMTMEDGSTDEIQLKAAQDLLDRGDHPKGMRQTQEWGIEPETLAFFDRIIQGYTRMVGVIDVEAKLREFTPAGLLPGEPVPVLPGSS